MSFPSYMVWFGFGNSGVSQFVTFGNGALASGKGALGSLWVNLSHRGGSWLSCVRGILKVT